MHRAYRSRPSAFSLIELLVVIGIIAILIGLLMPMLGSMQAHARTIACQSNLRQLGQAMYLYANDNQGWLIPMVDDPTSPGGVRGMGTLVPPKERWPAVIFKIHGPDPATDNPADYCPKVILCPADLDPAMAHSYALNNPPAAHKCKLGSHEFNGLKPTDVVIAAEKLTFENDYYLEPYEGDLDRATAFYRHGLTHGSNYLFWDGHVELSPAERREAGVGSLGMAIADDGAVVVTRTIAILEDNEPRVVEMRAWLAEALPDYEVAFFNNANETIAWLSKHLARLSLISLDHDLLVRAADGRWIDGGTGREVVDFLVRLTPACPVLVHSSNEVAAQGMLIALRKHQWRCAQVRPYEDVSWIRQAWADAIVKLLRDRR